MFRQVLVPDEQNAIDSNIFIYVYIRKNKQLK
jgi:hypothetical protein